MKVTIDTEALKRFGISMADVGWLMVRYYDGLDEKRMEDMFLYKGRLNRAGKSVLENIYLESEKDLDKNIDIDTGEVLEESVTVDGVEYPLRDTRGLAVVLKAIYPKGMKEIGGSHYAWTESVELVSRRLKLYFKKYGKKNFRDIVQATANYVNRFDGDYDGMWILRNFIFKDKMVNGMVEEQSYLDTEVSMVEEQRKEYEEIIGR